MAYRPLLVLPSDAPALAFERWLFEPAHAQPLLVLVGSLWLAWRRRHALARATTAAQGRPGPAAGLFAAAAAVHAWATLTQADFLLVPSLMLAALGWTVLRAGSAGCRALALPIGFLVFAIPVPGPILNLLVWEQQEAIGRVTAALLGLFGVPATAAGILFASPGRLFLVIETCSGFRMAEVFAALAVLGRGFAPPGAGRTLAVGALGALVGLVINELRVLWIALGSGPLAVGDAHAVQGVAALALGVPLLALLHRLLREPPARREPPAPGSWGGGAWRSLAGLLVLLAGLSFALAPEAPPRAPAFDLAGIPAARDGWQSELLRTDFQLLGSVRFDQAMRRAYAAPGGESVELFVGTSLSGDPQSSPFSRSTELPESGWIVLERFPTEVRGRPVEGLVLATDGARALAFTWRLGDLGLLRETLRAGLALDRNPFAEPRRRAVVRIATTLEDEGELERARASGVLEAFVDVFADTLPDADEAAAQGRERG